MLTPTPEQQNIIEAVARGESLAMVAFAGAAKTSTAVMSERDLDCSRLNVAFSKRNQLDFEEKMPKGTENRTFNSLGHVGVNRLTGKRCVPMVNYSGREKTYFLMDELGYSRDDFPDFAQLIGLLKNNGYVPSGSLNNTSGQTPPGASPLEIVEDFDLDMGEALPEAIQEAADKTLRASIMLSFQGTIDFDDQLYISTLWGAPFQIYDLIFVDEAQDLSPIQHMMVHRLTQGGRKQLVIAGDPHQAIYAFRGALSNSFDVLREDFNLNTYSLSVSFRCAKAIVSRAQTIVPGIQPWDEAPQGEVLELGRDGWVPQDFAYGDTILCRNTKPLIPLFYSTIAQGIGAKVLGSDIGKGLITIVKKLLKQNPNATREWLTGALKEWGQSQYIHYLNKKKLDKARARQEQADILTMIASRERDGRDVVSRLEGMFSDKKAPVTFSTIHKAKGLEWPRVWFLNPYLIPSIYAETEEELQQEQNLKYVGVTRAQRSLRFINTME